MKRLLRGTVLAALVAAAPAGRGELAARAADRIDYLTFAQGAVPISVGGPAAALGANFERALQSIDGNPLGFVLTGRLASSATDTEFVYALPAPTTFDRFAVPNVLETPSPSQTFTRLVEVHGSASGPADGYLLLASGTLSTHKSRGEVTELTLTEKKPVQWIKLRLQGGIATPVPQMFLEFSEIIGNGTQETPALVDHFKGTWEGKGVSIHLNRLAHSCPGAMTAVAN